jgi:hypothetical protein
LAARSFLADLFLALCYWKFAPGVVDCGLVGAMPACRAVQNAGAMEDMGENLVGAYMRQVRGCRTVAFNTFLPWGQGEIDVIGVKSGEPVQVWLAGVAVHLDSLNYGGYQSTTVFHAS